MIPADVPAMWARRKHTPDSDVCMYFLAHAQRGIPAMKTITCGPIGDVRVCDECAEFYKTNSTREPE